MSDSIELPTTRAVVATLVATQGATPKAAGSRMWVGADGAILGAVTIGGCVDARVIEEASRVLASGKPTLLSMSLGDEDAWALGMTCAGSIEVLIEPIDPSAPGDQIAKALRLARAETEAGRRVVVVSPLAERCDRLVVLEQGQRAGTLGDPAMDSSAMTEAMTYFASGTSGTSTFEIAGVAHRMFFELMAPPLSLVIFGATHVAMPLVAMARELGLRTIVVDGRDRFATRERFPTVDDLIVGMPSEIAERLVLGKRSLVVLLSHDYKYDLPVLRAVLASEAVYVGCLGSARRGKAMLEFLAEQGVPAEQLARVRIPVGLDIGARSAAEIALSVMAEAIAVERGHAGGAMRERKRADRPDEN